MTDKEFKIQQRRVKKYLDKWQKPGGFGWFDIQIEWDREHNLDNDTTLASCWSNWQYRHATIRFYLPIVKDQSDDELEKAVIHELSHILLSGLQDFSTKDKRDLTEYTTTLITDAIYWAHTNVKREAKK